MLYTFKTVLWPIHIEKVATKQTVLNISLLSPTYKILSNIRLSTSTADAKEIMGISSVHFDISTYSLHGAEPFLSS